MLASIGAWRFDSIWFLPRSRGKGAIVPKQFSGLGVSMLYPDNWKMDEDADSEAAIFESPEGAFLSLSRIADSNRDPMSEAQAAMASEYERVEDEELNRGTEFQIIQ